MRAFAFVCFDNWRRNRVASGFGSISRSLTAPVRATVPRFGLRLGLFHSQPGFCFALLKWTEHRTTRSSAAPGGGSWATATPLP